MDQTKLRSKLKVLQNVIGTPKKQRLKLLRTCDDEQIHALCEACLNVLNNTPKLNGPKLKKVKRVLRHIKRNIRSISNPKISVKHKRQILSDPQTGRGIFSVIASVVIPAIISALAK